MSWLFQYTVQLPNFENMTVMKVQKKVSSKCMQREKFSVYKNMAGFKQTNNSYEMRESGSVLLFR